MQWKGKIQEGVTNTQLPTTMGFLPTFAEISGAKTPNNLILDGKSFKDVILKNKK